MNISNINCVINIGLEWFRKSYEQQGIRNIHLDFKPPCGGEKKYIDKLVSLINPEIESANKEATNRLIESQPILIDIAKAIDVIPGMNKSLILHSGPPIEVEEMCGPMFGALIGAVIFEGLARDVVESEKIIKSKKIKFEPCHHHNSVGPMAGVISPSMYVFVVKNEKYGNYAYCNINEGLGKVLRFGAYSPDVIKRLKWINTTLALVLKSALKKYIKKKKTGINIKYIIAQALNMGDECHNRNISATGLFLKEILPYLMDVDIRTSDKIEVINFISENPHFFLNISMAACKSTADTILGLKNSTIVSAMSRNGVKFGIRIAGLGDKWFITESSIPKGLYFPGFSEKDANPDIGDSTITETVGLGAFAMACAPAITKFVGGDVNTAFNCTKEMYKITYTKHRYFTIPNLDFIGTPTGIDIRKIVEHWITPHINTGIAHKKRGIGQIGAGMLSAPMKPFLDAFLCC